MPLGAGGGFIFSGTVVVVERNRLTNTPDELPLNETPEHYIARFDHWSPHTGMAYLTDTNNHDRVVHRDEVTVLIPVPAGLSFRPASFRKSLNY